MGRNEQRIVGRSGDPAPLSGRIAADNASLWLLILANAAALAIAQQQHWSLLMLFFPYWVQNVVIGWYSARRMLALKRFTSGTIYYDHVQEVADPQIRKLIARGLPTPEQFVKRNTVKFFAAHYGIFHVGYLMFMIFAIQGGKLGEIPVPLITGVDVAWLAVSSLAFVLVHRTSFKRNLEHDQQGCRSIDALMFLPYARIAPMHITLVFGLTLGYAGAVMMFGILKAFADVLMHWFEHRVLAAS